MLVKKVFIYSSKQASKLKILIFLLMIAGVQSCVKDTSPPINDSVPDIVQNDIIQDDIGQQIQNFIKSMENYDSRSGLRGGSTDGSTAMQDVENAMNYTYGWSGTK